MPSLWVYAKNDSFFGPAVVERMQAAFLDGGGDVELVMLEADERADGHFIFGLASGRFKWLPQMDAFLRFHKLPTWTRDDVNALIASSTPRSPRAPSSKTTSRGRPSALWRGRRRGHI